MEQPGGWEDAEISEAKFTEYSLNPENVNNRLKAVAFAAVGYDIETSYGRRQGAVDLIQQLRAALATETATESRHPALLGTRWIVRPTIRGPNGRTGTLHTVWERLPGRPPRLITNWLELHREAQR